MKLSWEKETEFEYIAEYNKLITCRTQQETWCPERGGDVELWFSYIELKYENQKIWIALEDEEKGHKTVEKAMQKCEKWLKENILNSKQKE